MAVKVSTSALLLDALIDNPSVKATVLVDDRGYILEQRGSAQCIRDDDATMITSKKPSLENLYLVEAGDDFLLVIFDERLNFERLKKSVDETLGQFDFAPESNP